VTAHATGPRSVLFLSCDITGSTAYKQRGARWQRTFLSFYREFPQVLGELVEAARPDLDFTLWKAIGDELIFTSAVSDERDVFDAVRIWIDAMSKYEADSLGDEGLGTKGGAFIATVPGPDSQCAIPRDPVSQQSDKGIVTLNREALAEADLTKYQYDYFGPSIDTGFRVVSVSSARFFTLAVEVAWAMQRCNHDAKDDPGRVGHQDLGDLQLLGTKLLKGVWREREYPVFALDRQREDPVYKGLRELDGVSCDPEVVGRVCAACLASGGWPSAIYLPRSTFEPFKTIPPDQLDGMDDNEMIGAETQQPPEGPAAQPLEDSPPFG